MTNLTTDLQTALNDTGLTEDQYKNATTKTMCVHELVLSSVRAVRGHSLIGFRSNGMVNNYYDAKKLTRKIQFHFMDNKATVYGLVRELINEERSYNIDL